MRDHLPLQEVAAQTHVRHVSEGSVHFGLPIVPHPVEQFPMIEVPPLLGLSICPERSDELLFPVSFPVDLGVMLSVSVCFDHIKSTLEGIVQ